MHKNARRGNRRTWKRGEHGKGWGANMTPHNPPAAMAGWALLGRHVGFQHQLVDGQGLLRTAGGLAGRHHNLLNNNKSQMTIIFFF